MRKYLRGIGRGEFGPMLVERWRQKGGNLSFEAGYLRGRVSFGTQEKEGLQGDWNNGVSFSNYVLFGRALDALRFL